MDRIAILGGGSWGTALALLVARKSPGGPIRLWVHDPLLARSMSLDRINGVYLPGFKLHPAIEVTADLRDAVRGATLIVGAIPSNFAREVYTAAFAAFDELPAIVSATKGLEIARLARMSQVIQEVAATRKARKPLIATLSGPSFAMEAARGDPIAVVTASNDSTLAGKVQQLFSASNFRVYTCDDMIGVELGGALKNIMAIAAGICVGLGFGHSTLASLITRGAAEMTRLSCALDARPRTLAGLSGIGDLVLTATGPLSRNRCVGIELGRGRRLVEILQSMRMVAEGVSTTIAARKLARTAGVEMPITEQMYSVLYEGREAREAIGELMQRRLREE